MQDSEDTRGLTQRELLLEIRQDVKDLRRDDNALDVKIQLRPQRTEVYSAIFAIVTLAIAYAALFV